MKIVTNKQKLKKITEPCISVAEGEEIAKKIIRILETEKRGIGLAANQIGIQKSVCVVNARKDGDFKVLINPKIEETSEETITFSESCLSLPGRIIKTKRYKSITVSCDNWANSITFGPDDNSLKEIYSDEGLLECVCIQHEIDHLNGIIISDSFVKARTVAITNENKVGRNDKIQIQKDGETIEIKFKNLNTYLTNGWEII